MRKIMVSIMMPPDLWAAFKTSCESQEVSMSKQLKALVKDWLDGQKGNDWGEPGDNGDVEDVFENGVWVTKKK